MKRIAGFLFIYLMGLSACERANPNPVMVEYESPDIPNIEVLTGDSRLRKDATGTLYFDQVKFSGLLVSYFDSSKLMTKTSYFDGLLEGNMLKYYENGQLQYERPYRLGKKHGNHVGYYEDGSKKFHYIFEKGKSEGNHKEWFRDGSLFKDLNYKNGRPLGSQKVWRTDGKIRSNYVIRENGKRYGLMGIKRCTKLDTEQEAFDPYVGE